MTPSHVLGVHLRRRLARALGGVVGLEALTLPDLADRVAGVSLAESGRRPLPPAADRVVVAHAIRAAIPATGGYFSRVADLPNFPSVLWATLLDLRRAGVTPEAVETLDADTPAGQKRRELAACYRAALALLAEHGYYDASDLLVEAARLLAREPARLEAAAVYLVGFAELNPIEARLIAACRGAAPVSEYPAEADEAARPPSHAIEVVAAPGEEREVREIARAILDHAARGGRFDEVGVLLRQPAAYRTALRDVFAAAGIPWVFVGGVAPTLAETRSGRSLGLLLEARRSDFARGAVLELLAFADLRPAPGTSPAEWERLSRQAGIVRGARHWHEGLGRLDRGLARRLTGEDVRATTVAALGRDRDALTALRRTASSLIRQLSRVPGEGTAAEFVGPITRAFARLVAASAERDRVLGALAGLTELEPLRPRLTLDEFQAVLAGLLGGPADPDQSGGGGPGSGKVFVGALHECLGLSFPVLALPGLVEGGFPATARQDPILLDAERRALPGLLPSTAARVRDRMAFAVAVTSGSRRLLLTYPRVDAESGRPRVPSVFLLDLLAEVTGRLPAGAAIETFPGYRQVPLHPAPASARRLPLDPREWLVTRALDARLAPGPLLRGLPAAARGWATIEARERSARLTPFDGLVPGGLPASSEAPLAPTALQAYAACPFSYFLGQALGVAPVEEPDELLTLSPLERGRIVHQALEGTFRRLRDAGALPLGPATLPAARAALEAAFDEAGQDAEQRGVTGLPALWQAERTRLGTALLAGLHAEAREAQAWVPALFEVAFGIPWLDPATPPLVYRLPDDTVLAFRGRIDRIDLSPDGSRARVIDYKTGRVAGGRRADRLARGRALQLPIYRLAAEAVLRARGLAAEVEDACHYHLLGADAGARVRFTRAGWESRQKDFDRVLALCVEGIREGRFFVRPDGCAIGRGPCRFDLACGAERVRWAELKANDPAALRHADLDGIE